MTYPNGHRPDRYDVSREGSPFSSRIGKPISLAKRGFLYNEAAVFNDKPSELPLGVAGNPNVISGLPVGLIPPTMPAHNHLTVIQT